jgi:dienelactone hydrolase
MCDLSFKFWCRFLAVFWVSAAFVSTSFAGSDDCRPYQKGLHQLVEVRPGFHTVTGELADFDPCHPKVSLALPGVFADKLAELPPVFIIIHGGGGLTKPELELARELNSRGIASLVFDAYELNGYSRDKDWRLFLLGMSNEARQRMIYKASLGAYEWLRKQKTVDTSRIFIHGLSNGGSVAANLAGAVDPKFVRTVFPEGASASGLGFPLDITVPVRMIYGKLDNYGSPSEDGWQHLKRPSCAFNVLFPIAPPGTSASCSARVNPESQMISAKMWIEELRKKGRDADIWLYDDAAHGIMAGPIDRGVRVYGKGPTAKKMFGWTGSSGSAREKLLTDLLKVVQQTYQ